MRLVFLDIDGVLNSLAFTWQRGPKKKRETCCDEDLDPKAIALLNARVLVSPDVHIVISSSWRVPFKDDFGALVKLLEDCGLERGRIIGATPRFTRGERKALEAAWAESTGDVTPYLGIYDTGRGQRGDEIREWLDDATPLLHVTNFVVVDDDDDMNAVRDNFVQTDWRHGLTEKEAIAMSEILNR